MHECKIFILSNVNPQKPQKPHTKQLLITNNTHPIHSSNHPQHTHTHSLDDGQQKIVELALLVDVQKQVRIVQRNAAPHQIAARNLFVLLVERHATLASDQLQHGHQLAVWLRNGLAQNVRRFALC